MTDLRTAAQPADHIPDATKMVPEALRLAQEYADAVATHRLENLYGTSRSYTLEKARERDEAFTALDAELRRLHAENEALRAEIEADERNLCQLTDELAASRREVDALKAERDRLMLEFCPDEMTQQQKTEWATHQNVNWYPIQYKKRKFKGQP